MARLRPIRLGGSLLVLPARAGMARWPPSPPHRHIPFSPHARGWPAAIFPATEPIQRSPRTRGDGPVAFQIIFSPVRVLPARAGMARRCRSPLSGPRSVLPARAGMARQHNPLASPSATFSPHARGWPNNRRRLDHPISGSPRTRGDGPGDPIENAEARQVLPARAGMARCLGASSRGPAEFSPHARGWPG